MRPDPDSVSEISLKLTEVGVTTGYLKEGSEGGVRRGIRLRRGQMRNFEDLGVIQSNYRVVVGQFRHLP